MRHMWWVPFSMFALFRQSVSPLSPPSIHVFHSSLLFLLVLLIPLLSPLHPLPFVSLLMPSLFQQYITNEGNQFIVQTNFNAPNYCLVKVDLSKPERVGCVWACGGRTDWLGRELIHCLIMVNLSIMDTSLNEDTTGCSNYSTQNWVQMYLWTWDNSLSVKDKQPGPNGVHYREVSLIHVILLLMSHLVSHQQCNTDRVMC